MEDRFNTIAGWTLAGFGAALGLSLVSGLVFKHEEKVEGGYPLADVAGGGDDGAKVVPIDWTKVDAAAGEAVFAQCKACHTIDAGGANGTGPNIHGVAGRAKASVAGFAYSDAVKALGGSWTIADLDHWLLKPGAMAAGTKMTYGGLKDPVKRGNLIAYINAQGSNLPYPAGAPAEAAPAEGAAKEAAAAPAANAAAPAANAAAPAANAAAPAK
jgi:cytochrome c